MDMTETIKKKKYQGQEYQLIFEVLGKKRDTSTGGD